MMKILFSKSSSLILFFVLCCSVLVGCMNETSGEDDDISSETNNGNANVSTITAVLEEEFNGPDKKYLQITDEIEKSMLEDDVQAYERGAPELRAYEDYVKETYKNYFTENGYASFKPFAFLYHSKNDYKIGTESIEVVQISSNENNYRFVVQIQYQNDSETKKYKITGSAIFPEEGKIGKISFDENEDMMRQIMNPQN